MRLGYGTIIGREEIFLPSTEFDIQSSSMAHPPFYLMDFRDSFLGSKADEV
jgi:hypothetical protein